MCDSAWMNMVTLLHILVLIVAPASNAGVPLPTPAQLAYQRAELIATVGFQMNSFAYGVGGLNSCNAKNWNIGPRTSDPTTLAPTHLNTTQWAEVVSSFGAKIAWMDAKHVCGFLLWPTQTKLPDGRPYGYDVSAPGALQRDVVKEFRDAFVKAGIRPGYYYSFSYNYYLNVAPPGIVGPPSTFLPKMVNVTQQEYEDLVLMQMRELWSTYGSKDVHDPNNIAEVWFDGGWSQTVTGRLKALVEELVPRAVAFGGNGISDSPVRWVGTESGLPVGPIWSMGNEHHGSPTSDEFVPKGCDTVLMTPHTWFDNPGMGVRTLEDMINVYHHTVGNNCNLELGFAALRDGYIPEAQVKRAKDLGDWIQECYSQPLASVNEGWTAPLPDRTATQLELTLPLNATEISWDRVMIREDLALGQRVRKYLVEAQLDGEWLKISNGASVGNKRIDLTSPLQGTWKLRLSVLEAVAPPSVSFAVFAPCPTGSEIRTLA